MCDQHHKMYSRYGREDSPHYRVPRFEEGQERWSAQQPTRAQPRTGGGAAAAGGGVAQNLFAGATAGYAAQVHPVEQANPFQQQAADAMTVGSRASRKRWLDNYKVTGRSGQHLFRSILNQAVDDHPAVVKLQDQTKELYEVFKELGLDIDDTTTTGHDNTKLIQKQKRKTNELQRDLVEVTARYELTVETLQALSNEFQAFRQQVLENDGVQLPPQAAAAAGGGGDDDSSEGDYVPPDEEERRHRRVVLAKTGRRRRPLKHAQ